jgi:hypothetical protein
MDKDRLTPEELARKWNISESTLNQWRWTGRGPKFVKIARQITYKIKEIVSCPPIIGPDSAS